MPPVDLVPSWDWIGGFNGPGYSHYGEKYYEPYDGEDIEDPATREEMRSWARHEFKRNKNVEEMVSISSFRELHGVIFAVLFEPNIMSPWVHHVESADANSLPDISAFSAPYTPAFVAELRKPA
ncbi:hypothetical protein TWF703_005726 [Orbilia oligospora]|uniref:Uncharacterized protein n=1 Tax=Orbilia oligospora TaxID=2813651 RepID=A0A7C8JX71_ORBOL|nr:hypothetical protein TWF703_005726 [Orbilia oligospora]